MTREEAISFLAELGRKIKNQNNRGTARPYYFVGIRKEKFVCHPEYNRSVDYYCKYDSEMTSEFKSTPDGYLEFEKLALEGGWVGTKEMAKERWEELEEVPIAFHEEDDNVFLTEEGFEKHVRLNAHNLPKDYRSYVKHAFRNPEMEGLVQAIITLSES